METLKQSLTVTPLSNVLGAEIGGLELHEELDNAAIEQLRKAWLDHRLLLVRDQDLNDVEHRRFCQYLGELQMERTAKDVESKETAGMLFVSNVRADAILPSGDMWFHSDQCYFDKPGKATSLYAIETPTSGGNTRFANCHLAYESLARIVAAENRRTFRDEHVCLSVTERVQETRQREKPRPIEYPHPMVRTHPETGRKSLYVNRLMTDYIVDMDETESRELLDTLFDHMENEDFIYEHSWRNKDLVIWENRCLVHARTNFDPSQRRLLRRFALQGDKPS